MDNEIIVTHNFDGKKFKWLYAKYACGVNPNHHCTNAIRGKYSKKFNRNNPNFAAGQEIVFDEFKAKNWDAIYICGVSANGYAKKLNYPHNAHIAIVPAPGNHDEWQFENWKMSVVNGKFEYVIDQDELDEKFKNLPDDYVTCRMFRWAVDHYKSRIEKMKPEEFDSKLYCNTSGD